MKTSRKTRRRVAIALELEWPYRRHVDVYLGTQRYAREKGTWDCVIDEYPDCTSRGGYDGIIARAGTALVRQAQRHRMPIVNVWHNAPVREIAGVYPDYYNAGRLAAEHFLERGLRRFACALFPRNRTHQLLVGGFADRLEEVGHSCAMHPADADEAERSPGTWRRFRRTMARWIARWQCPIGIFVCFAGYTARHLVNACHGAGVRVPEDVAIVMADNDLPVCLQPPPTLTGIDLRHEQVGYEAARQLDRLMSRVPEALEPRLVVPGGVYARQSTDFFAAEDELVVAAMRFIARHIEEPIRVNDVASALKISRRTLERRFEKGAGRRIAVEIRRLRIERARRLLLDSDMPIKQVAHAAGFGTSLQMYQVFRHFLGTTPSAFRQS
jgi:LacI family transcriptional regulator